MTDTAPTPDPTPTPEGAARYPLLAAPHVRLHGPVNDFMYTNFCQQLADCPASGTIVVTLTTLGGDPEIARAMGDDIRLLREFHGRDILFLGKVAVYSAGATFMAAFPVAHRFLTKQTRIMVHERRLVKSVNLDGPLRMLAPNLRQVLHEVEHSILIEEEGFRDLIAGSRVSFDEIHEKAPNNWYIEAEEARDLGLVLDVI